MKNSMKISDKDVDDLVLIAEGDEDFKKDLQKIDQIAFMKKQSLKDIIQEAVDWYIQR